MLSTILVRLRVPVLDEQFDLMVPLDMPISLLSDVTAKGLEDLSNGRYSSSGYELLAMERPDLLLNPSLTLRNYGIPDGADLILL